MNKKLVLPIMLVLGISFVFAIGYYAVFSTTFNVLPSITTEGALEQTIEGVFDGESYPGSPITLTNEALTERTLTLSDDAEVGIEVSYVGTLVMTKKDTSTWQPVDPADTKEITINYCCVLDSIF